MSLLEKARLRERNYHIAFYGKHTIGDVGTWLENPAPYALASLQYTPEGATRALDLGAGIGRHAIPIARYLGPGSAVVCVDILESALEKLRSNVTKAGVGGAMQTLVTDIEDYQPEGHFDYVLSVSVIEHVSSKQALQQIVTRLQAATRPGGVHCFMIATEHEWIEIATGRSLKPLVELNMTARETQAMLRDLYKSWEIKDISTKIWEVPESFNNRDIICKSTCVQFTASNGGSVK